MPVFHLARHSTTCRVMSRRDVTYRAFSDMAEKEATLITCTSLVFHALESKCHKYKKLKHAVWVRDYLTKTDFDFWHVQRVVWHDKTCCAQQMIVHSSHVEPSGICAYRHCPASKSKSASTLAFCCLLTLTALASRSLLTAQYHLQMFDNTRHSATCHGKIS